MLLICISSVCYQFYPYNINLAWEVIETAGKSGSIEIFLNFMTMDINRNALRKRMEKSLQSKVDQLTRLVGDESCKDAGYREIETLFGTDYQKVSNEEFADWFRQRLIHKAGFQHVLKPMPMKTKNNAMIDYLYFATQNTAGLGIVNDIFCKIRTTLKWQSIPKSNGRTPPRTRSEGAPRSAPAASTATRNGSPSASGA